MNFKIVDPGSDYPVVLLHRDRDEEEREAVRIVTFGKYIDGEDELEDYCIEETIGFENAQTAKDFIFDFSTRSAVNWCENHQIKD